MFYVTAIFGQKAIALLGPYDDHQNAIDNIDKGRKMAIEYDSTGRADFAAFGTAKLKTKIKSAFGV